MKLNRKWLLVIALLLSVAAATAGTLAYLSDSDADVNTMTLGSVYIVQNEQQRNEDGMLEPFENNKPAYPAVGPVEWTPEGEGVNVNGTEYKVFTDELANVIDKIVTVTNTGKSDAYVRTIVAIEAPGYDPENLIHVNVNGDKEDVVYTPWEPVVIDGKEYVYSVFTYQKALAPDETSVPSLVQLFLDSKADNKDVEAFGDTWEVLVLSQGVQTAGFSDAATALDTGFGLADDDNVAKWLSREDEENSQILDNIGSPGDKNDTNNPPVPFAQVTILDEDDTLKLTKKGEEIIIVDANRTIDTDGTGNFGLKVGKIPLDVAYQFEPTMSEEEGKASEWAYWHADFVVSADKDIPAYGIGLAGFYDAWCSLINDNKWVLLTSPDVIPADTQIRLVEVMGGGQITVAYKDLCEYGNDGIGFLCGAVDMNGTGKMIDGEIPEALTPGTTLTVELRLYEVIGGADGYETGEYMTAGVYEYTFD